MLGAQVAVEHESPLQRDDAEGCIASPDQSRAVVGDRVRPQHRRSRLAVQLDGLPQRTRITRREPSALQRQGRWLVGVRVLISDRPGDPRGATRQDGVPSRDADPGHSGQCVEQPGWRGRVAAPTGHERKQEANAAIEVAPLLGDQGVEKCQATGAAIVDAEVATGVAEGRVRLICSALVECEDAQNRPDLERPRVAPALVVLDAGAPRRRNAPCRTCPDEGLATGVRMPSTPLGPLTAGVPSSVSATSKRPSICSARISSVRSACGVASCAALNRPSASSNRPSDDAALPSALSASPTVDGS